MTHLMPALQRATELRMRIDPYWDFGVDCRRLWPLQNPRRHATREDEKYLLSSRLSQMDHQDAPVISSRQRRVSALAGSAIHGIPKNWTNFSFWPARRRRMIGDTSTLDLEDDIRCWRLVTRHEMYYLASALEDRGL